MLLIQVCWREVIVCSAIAQVFKWPNRDLFYNGIMHVFWAQSSFVDRLGNSVCHKNLETGVLVFFLHPANSTWTSDCGWLFSTPAFEKNQTLAFCIRYFDPAWGTSVTSWLSLDENILTAFPAMPHSQQRAGWRCGIGSTSWWLVWMTWTLKMNCMTKWSRPWIMPLLSVAREPVNPKRTSSGGWGILVFVQGRFGCF